MDCPSSVFSIISCKSLNVASTTFKVINFSLGENESSPRYFTIKSCVPRSKSDFKDA